ncbi:MAG: carboxypeptidase-like regulatory domain-containing protein [Verrucomicrobiia bacterium]
MTKPFLSRKVLTAAATVTAIISLVILYQQVFGSRAKARAYHHAQATLDPEKDKDRLHELWKTARDADSKFQWRIPISFYGKVVDENGKPVGEAKIEFGWTDISYEGSSKRHVLSDSNGLFSLTGVRGKRLTVEVGKDGYHELRSQNPFAFEYADYFGFFRPDPAHPVVFHLLKANIAEPMVQRDCKVVLKLDGSPVYLNVLTGKTGQAGQMEIRKWRAETWQEDRRNGLKFDWRVLLRIPDGGFIDVGKEMPFTAPATGYSPEFDINLPKRSQTWATAVTRKMCFVFGNPPRYGRMKLDADGIDHSVYIELWINPSGSRNLEYDYKKDITKQFE